MMKWEPIIVRGEHFLELLSTVHNDTLARIRFDLGEMTFANASLIQIIEREISNREKRAEIGARDTLEVDEPDFELMD